ncbi:MAG: signal peptidase I [Clostridia bacterium]|nr:signal peptidase I [Clostridia bacterium]
MKGLRRTERYKATFHKNEIERKRIHPTVLKVYEWAGTFVSSFVVVFILVAFIFRTASVSGSSMVPTLESGDKLIVSNLVSNYGYGDIVVVCQPNFLNENLIKRVIAVGGDTVDIDFVQGIVYINGKKIDELYINTMTNLKPSDSLDFPLVVPQGFLFVMGDNRNASLDSRSQSIGLIDERYIFGKAYFRILPFGEWGIY